MKENIIVYWSWITLKSKMLVFACIPGDHNLTLAKKKQNESFMTVLQSLKTIKHDRLYLRMKVRKFCSVFIMLCHGKVQSFLQTYFFLLRPSDSSKNSKSSSPWRDILRNMQAYKAFKTSKYDIKSFRNNANARLIQQKNMRL